MKKHLAVFKGSGAEDILSGKKTIESRFSHSKIAPYGVISKGDLVYIKPSGKDIIGQFRVKKVFFFDGLTPDDILDIKKQFGNMILMDDDFWQSKKDCQFATLIFIGEQTTFITSPIKPDKKDLRGWMVLD